jgi:hypothetical protein
VSFPFIAIFVGLGFIYAGFSKEDVPSVAPKADFQIDERIDIEGAGHVQKETSTCKQYFVPGEKLVAIVLGEVEGEPELDRLALTDKRILLYSANQSRDALKFDYRQIAGVDVKRGNVLQHLGEINLFVEGQHVRFKNVLQESLEQVLNTISERKQWKSNQRPKR